MTLDGFPAVCTPECLTLYLEKRRSYRGPKRSWKVLKPDEWQVFGGNRTYWSEHLQRSFRSDVECRVADYLFLTGEQAIYEPFTFVIPPMDGHAESYCTPDLWLYNRDLFLEVKGVWGMGQRDKYRRLVVAYPDVNVLFIPAYLVGQFRRLNKALA